ncbi:DUF3795 domain-containing protein [Marinilabiliaceae bacterium JC017]|nr:DUF3795 domain-containing protein [Marinilabiliaceae bacterium JC017]
MEKKSLVSFCGLYCGACPSYKKGKCPGCAENEKASWCKIRRCCLDKKISSCAQCQEYEQVTECKKFNNFVSRLFALVFRSDRAAGIKMLREEGPEAFVAFMSDKNWVAIKKGSR